MQYRPDEKSLESVYGRIATGPIAASAAVTTEVYNHLRRCNAHALKRCEAHNLSIIGTRCAAHAQNAKGDTTDVSHTRN